MLKIREASQLLGIAEITLRQWIQHDKIKSVKIGRSRRIAESEVIRLQRGELRYKIESEGK